MAINHSEELILEQLSALTDGELGDDEMDQLMGALGDLPDDRRAIMMEKWTRYQYITSPMRASMVDVSAAVSAAIEREPLLQVVESGNVQAASTASSSPSSSSSSSSLLSPSASNADQVSNVKPFRRPVLAQWAVAASVCFSVVLGWQLLSHNAEQTVTAPVVAHTSLESSELVAGRSSASNFDRPQVVATNVATHVANPRPLPTPESIPVVDASKWAASGVSVESVESVESPASDQPGMSHYYLQHDGTVRLATPAGGPLPLVKMIHVVNR